MNYEMKSTLLKMKILKPRIPTVLIVIVVVAVLASSRMGTNSLDRKGAGKMRAIQ